MEEANPEQGTAASAELRREFWAIVLLLNLALLALALGLMILGFWSRPGLAAGLFVIGLVAGLAAWRRYRRVREGKA